MQNIIIDNRDTENIHIDTYQTLTGDNATESELEYINDEREPNTPKLTYDDFDWTYDHAQIVKDFAHASIQIITDAIANTPYADIIKDITLLDTSSPRYYNYTTDGYTAIYTINADELAKYIETNRADIIAIAEKYDATIIDSGIISPKNMQHAAICHILNNCITADDYNMAMWEVETEVYYENTKREPITK